MSRKVIKSITLKIGSGETVYNVTAAPSDVPLSVDKVDVTCLADAFKQFLPSPQPERGAMAFTIANESGSVRPSIGVVQDFVFTVVYSDGTSTPIDPVTVTVNGFLTKCDPAKGETGANRHATWECEMTPTGVVAA